ncbi:MAG: TAXI family TRAP transporter solute-binding subunit [Hyphomicrobiales bacterium]
MINRFHTLENQSLSHDTVTRPSEQPRMVAILAILAALLLGFFHATQPARAETVYNLYTGSSSSNYHPVGVALATLIKLKRAESNNVLLKVEGSRGPADNMHALLKGDADVAFVDASTILAAITKKPPFDQYENSRLLRSLATLWVTKAHLVMRGNFVRKDELEDFRSLIGQAVSFGQRGSLSYSASSQLLRKNGLIHDKLFSIPSLDPRESVDAFSNDVINGFALFSHSGDHIIKDAFYDNDNEAVLLNISDEQLSKLNDDEIPIWSPSTIKANTYPNQPKPVHTVGQENFLVTLSSFPREDALHITRTFYENLTFLKALHPAAEKIESEISRKHLIAPLHTGSEKYFLEEKPCAGLFCVFN